MADAVAKLKEKDILLTKEPEVQVAGHALLKWLETRMFVLNYRAKYNVKAMNILAMNIEEANNKGESYCTRFGLRFISVVPFFGNLDRDPDKRNVASY